MCTGLQGLGILRLEATEHRNLIQQILVKRKRSLQKLNYNKLTAKETKINNKCCVRVNQLSRMFQGKSN